MTLPSVGWAPWLLGFRRGGARCADVVDRKSLVKSMRLLFYRHRTQHPISNAALVARGRKGGVTRSSTKTE